MSEHDKQLESFFAKKEKGKKSKGKSKFTTSDAITKQVGSTQKEPDGRSKDQPSKKASGVTLAPSNTVWMHVRSRHSKTSSKRSPIILGRLIDRVTCIFFFLLSPKNGLKMVFVILVTVILHYTFFFIFLEVSQITHVHIPRPSLF